MWCIMFIHLVDHFEVISRYLKNVVHKNYEYFPIIWKSHQGVHISVHNVYEFLGENGAHYLRIRHWKKMHNVDEFDGKKGEKRYTNVY